MRVSKILNIDSSKYNFTSKSIIHYIEVEILDLTETINEVLEYVSNLSWINDLKIDWKQNSFKNTSIKTITKLESDFKNKPNDDITTTMGEYIVSIKGLKSLEYELTYTSLPLAELIKEQVSGNPGFDFYGLNLENVILFGEAKYNSSQNAYGVGLKQIARFIDEGKDIEELRNIQDLVEEDSCVKCNDGHKGYVVSFSLHTSDTEQLLKDVFKNKYFNEINKYNEIVLVGVKISVEKYDKKSS